MEKVFMWFERDVNIGKNNNMKWKGYDKQHNDEQLAWNTSTKKLNLQREFTFIFQDHSLLGKMKKLLDRFKCKNK